MCHVFWVSTQVLYNRDDQSIIPRFVAHYIALIFLYISHVMWLHVIKPVILGAASKLLRQTALLLSVFILSTLNKIIRHFRKSLEVRSKWAISKRTQALSFKSSSYCEWMLSFISPEFFNKSNSFICSYVLKSSDAYKSTALDSKFVCVSVNCKMYVPNVTRVRWKRFSIRQSGYS